MYGNKKGKDEKKNKKTVRSNCYIYYMYIL